MQQAIKSAEFTKLCKSYHLDPMEIPEIISFEDACKITGKDPLALPVVADEEFRIPTINNYKRMVITKAFNGDWAPDWTNPRQYKYYPWFDLSSGSGLSCYDYDYGSSLSAVGSRLCFRSWEIAKFVGLHFEKLFEEEFVIK